MSYSDFLLQLDKAKNKEIYAKVIALTFAETPIETIEGRITAGSINVDGNSAVRRTCSLTVVADNFNYDNYSWGQNTKFKLEIGVKNTVDKNYPDIIWFKQGYYILTSFNVSRSTTNFTINLSGKDKMCLLNGELGGSFESSVDFGIMEQETRNGVWKKINIPIKDIIRNAVHTYGGEPYHNIIINDLDSYGIELLEYRYDTPMYLWREADGDKALVYENAMLENDDVDLYILNDKNQYVKTKMSELKPSHLESLTTTIWGNDNITQPVYTYYNGTYTPWYFTRIEYGDTAGYRQTDLTYAGDLIAKVGESLTSILDKIKNMLVEFEYFYNLDGQFVFQKKQSFISTMWTPEQVADVNNDVVEAPESLAAASSIVYTFAGNELITAFNNNPNLTNLRNDFSIWGERTTTAGAKIPVHIRFAINEKPVKYTSIYVEANNEDLLRYNQQYETALQGQQTQYTYIADTGEYRIDGTTVYCDWREVIYQMAVDYYKYNHLDDFEIRVAQANPHYPTGRTGYESYYIDLQGFWRELYYPAVVSDVNDTESQYITLQNKISFLEEEIYGVNVDWSINKIGGVENDLIGLRDILNSDKTYSNAQKIINYWNSGTNHPSTLVNSMASYKIILLDKLTYIANTYYYRVDNNYILCTDNVFDEAKTYYRKTPALYDFRDDNQNLISDPDLYFGYLNDYYHRLVSKLNTYRDNFSELDKKRESLVTDRNQNYFVGDILYDKYEIQPHQLYWRKDVFEHPDNLNFWFDFLEGSGELSQFNVANIGARPKAIQDSNIKSIYFRETPSVVFRSSNDCIYTPIKLTAETYKPNVYYCLNEEYSVYVLSTALNFDAKQQYYIKTYEQMPGFKYIQVPAIDTMFTISSQGKSAKSRLDELLYKHSYCIETATITTIPIYYLQPNQRIKISDAKTSLYGDYIINKITIPLTYNGTMSLSVTKAVEDLL